jgi:hypothetical protein
MAAPTHDEAGQLFGRKCRLPVAAWVLGHGKRFHQSRPPRFGTTSQSNITEELERLVKAGMLIKDVPGDGRVYYEMTDSALWAVVSAAIKVTGLVWEDDRLFWRPPIEETPNQK